MLPHGGPPSHHTATLSFFAKSLRSSQRRLELEVVVSSAAFLLRLGVVRPLLEHVGGWSPLWSMFGPNLGGGS